MAVNLSEIKKVLLDHGIAPENVEFLVKPIHDQLTHFNRNYGLIWEVQPENRLSALKIAFPIFHERDCVKKTTERMNLLFQGDNLYSLAAMQYTHIKNGKGIVNIIYIDPPYFKGNKDFRFNDSFINMEDNYRHSSWLSFMEKRLKLAKDLLSDDGVIYLSIDDNEQAQLKLLCDQIFGEQNFIAMFPRITKKSGKTTKNFAKNTDYLLCYVKSNHNVIDMEEFENDAADQEDEYVATRGLYRLNQTLDYNSLSYSPSLDYPIELNGKTYYPGGDKDAYDKRRVGQHNRADWAWRWSKELFMFGLDNGFIIARDSGRLYTKTYTKAAIEKEGAGYKIIYEDAKRAITTLDFVENKYSNDNAKKDLKKLGLDGEAFDYPKPVSLIKRLIKCYTRSDAIVLDFFAGTGTTGQAVMELNQEAGGTRRFILCTDDENGICSRITYPRLKTVITGQKVNGEDYVIGENSYDILWKKKIPGGNKTYKERLCKVVDEAEALESTGYDAKEIHINDDTVQVFGLKQVNPYKGCNESIIYYELSLEQESTTNRGTIKKLIDKCVDYIKIKEDTFEIPSQVTEDLYVIDDNGRQVYICLAPYPNIDTLKEKLASKSGILYSMLDKTSKVNNINGFTLECYPQSIISIISRSRKGL